MADGWLPAGAQTALDAWAAVYSWFKLHTGAPGAAGTTNAATETTRKQATWRATTVLGVLTNSVAFVWTAISGSQDATDFTVWTASTAGSAGGSGTITANPYTAGDTYSVAIDAASISVTLAS